METPMWTNWEPTMPLPWPPYPSDAPESLRTTPYRPINPGVIEDFHAPITIQLGELIRDGYVIWGEPDWMWDYYDIKQYWRVSEKIEHHYFYRDIAITPPGAWRLEFVRTMNEIMPKYKLAYRQLDAGVDIMRTGEDYGKSRVVGSDFPATQLSTENNDYASDASDREYDDLHDGDWMDRVARLRDYDDIDLMIVKDIEPLFSCLITGNV